MNRSASELFIFDNSDTDWKVRSYLSEWCEIGALLCLQGKWQSVDALRILIRALFIDVGTRCYPVLSAAE